MFTDVYQSVTVDSDKQVIYIKLVNSGDSRKINVSLDGFENINAVSNQFIANRFKSASNEVGKQRVAPEEKKIKTDGNTFKVELKSNSVNVIRVAYGSNTGESLYRLPDNINLKTKGYVPTRVIAAVLIIGTCFVGGSIIGFLVYAKVLKKKESDKDEKE